MKVELKVVKFAKIIILMRCLFWQEMSNLYLPLKNDPNEGPLDKFFPIFLLGIEKPNLQKIKVKSIPGLS